MASIAVLVIIAGCAALQFFKGTLVRAAATIVVALIGVFVAFGYYEWVAGYLAQYLSMVGQWAQTVAFAFLFFLAFAFLQTGAQTILKESIDLGTWPERIGRPVFGAVLGWIIAGVVICAALLAPLPATYPYQRFDPQLPDADRPSGVLLYADSFVSGWFGMVSRGSLCAIQEPRGFAALRAGFPDQIMLNRLAVADKVLLSTKTPAIEVPARQAFWPAPAGLTDAGENPLAPKEGHEMKVVRIGLKSSASGDSSPFTMSQVRVICVPTTSAERPLLARGRCLFPLGIMMGPNQVRTQRLNELIEVPFGSDPVRWLDFVFQVPMGLVPAIAEFKLNNADLIPASVTADQDPQVIPFDSKSKSKGRGAEGEGKVKNRKGRSQPPAEEPQTQDAGTGNGARSESNEPRLSPPSQLILAGHDAGVN